MNKIEAYILDTETNDKENAQAIEVAHYRLSDGERFCQRYMPSAPISFGAMATHNIIESDLIGCPPSGSFVLPSDCGYMIGHNINFDYEVIGSPEGVMLIDTLPLSRMIFDDADSHTQMACMYRIDAKLARSMAHGAHGAMADVLMNEILFSHICDVLGVNPTDLSIMRTMIPAKMPFGKHSGVPMSAVPMDYKAWYARQSDTDPYVLSAMRGAKALTIEAAQDIISGSRDNAGLRPERVGVKLI